LYFVQADILVSQRTLSLAQRTNLGCFGRRREVQLTKPKRFRLEHNFKNSLIRFGSSNPNNISMLDFHVPSFPSDLPHPDLLVRPDEQ
jgi:hypothetical protein